MDELFVLLLMIFLHIVDDYYLQGILANLKQKCFWKENASDAMYKHDYIWALLMHSFSWTFMIMFPVAYLKSFEVNAIFLIVFITNVIIHAVTDHLKANVRIINLICDQLIHMMQIIVTWIMVIL